MCDYRMVSKSKDDQTHILMMMMMMMIIIIIIVIIIMMMMMAQTNISPTLFLRAQLAGHGPA